jgi:hypothetical protein
MKIKYNIATHKKISYFRYLLTALALIIISAAFIWGGILSLSNSLNRFQTEKAQLRAYKEKLEKKKNDEESFKKEIVKIKTSWSRKIAFANSIIDMKSFPHLERLNLLEERLPAGVFITRLDLRADNSGSIQFGVASISAEKLMEVYKAFLKYNLIISKETQVEGMYRASLEIKLQNEKK